MIRAPLGDQRFWNKWAEFDAKTIEENWSHLQKPSGNPTYRPQFVWDMARTDIFRYIMRKYSRGDDILSLCQPFGDLLDAWELSNKLVGELNTNQKPGEGWDQQHLLTAPILMDGGRKDPRSWMFELTNLNHYNWCFWLVGLALTLKIPSDLWYRLLALIGGEGEDILLDRVIASRQPDRQIGTKLLHKKPYGRLLAAIEAKDQELSITHQAELLYAFVQNWYIELERKGKDRLWWYDFGDSVKNPLEMGSYFGRWCIEAAAAVVAFHMDDRLCLGHEHYPGDLLHPDKQSTHPTRMEPKNSWLKRFVRKRMS